MHTTGRRPCFHEGVLLPLFRALPRPDQVFIGLDHPVGPVCLNLPDKARAHSAILPQGSLPSTAHEQLLTGGYNGVHLYTR